MLASPIAIFTFAVTCTFLYILNIVPAGKNGRNQYLNILLVCLGLHLIAELCMIHELITVRTYAVYALSLVLAYGPAIYFYTKKFHGKSTSRFALHLLPQLLGLWSIFYIHRSGIATLQEWMLSSYYAGSLLVYFVASYREIVHHQQEKHRRWMRTVGYGFGVLVLLYVIEAVVINANLPIKDAVVKVSTSVYNVFCCLFLLIAIRQIVKDPSPFSDVTLRIPYRTEQEPEPCQELGLILTFVVDEKNYRDPSLTRSSIATATGVSTHQVSEVVNSTFKKNFNDWVNDHRIEEAKELLIESDLNIKEIFYEVGFNSKSAFNNAFKKRTQTTPSSFRAGNRQPVC